MTKEMSLTEVQSVGLDILNHFHAFCVNHNIKYSLGYGTLIGAIRHHGFIPWDDDVDVVMLRDDYDKFCHLYEDSVKYKLFAPNRKNTYSACVRLCEMQNTRVITDTPLFTEETGIWIDIFPFDSVSDNKSEFTHMVNEAISSFDLIQTKRYIMQPWYKQVSGVRSLYGLIRRKWLFRHSIFDYVNEHVKLITAWSSRDTKMMSQLSVPDMGDREYYSKSLFQDVIEVMFENSKLFVMNGYDECLRIAYGDYMQLPPKEQQERGHTYHKYYWKD